MTVEDVVRLIAVSDAHGNVTATKRLSKEVSNVDAILFAGDITNFQGREAAINVLEPLLNVGAPLLAVFGNCDGRDVPELLDDLGISVHGRHINVGRVGVTGFGGSEWTPFGTPWEFNGSELIKTLLSVYVDGDVLLTHVPPYGTNVDKTFRGEHVGSRSLRRFIVEKKPPLLVCGHIHEARGVDELKGTIVVNPGPLMRGYYAFIQADPVSLRALKVDLRRV